MKTFSLTLLLIIVLFAPLNLATADECPSDGKWDGTKCILVGVCTLATEWNGTRCVAKGSIPAVPEVTNDIEKEVDALAERIDTDDGISSEEAEDIMNVIFTFLSDLFADNKDQVIADAKDAVGNAKDSIVEKLEDIEPKWGADIDGDGITDFDPDEDDPFVDNNLGDVKAGEYKIDNWPKNDGVKIVKIVDVFGVERYSSDGKHFYDTPYAAAHSSEGVSNVWNGAKDGWTNLWKAKNSDPDKQLRMDVAREVLSDAKSQAEKDLDNAYTAYQVADFANDAISVAKGGNPAMFLAGVPGDTIVAVTKEVSANDFSSAASVYIREREGSENNSPASIRSTMPELFGEGYGTLGNEGAISLKTQNEHAPAVLQARYEEAYQRYIIAKEFGRK